jgi:hypothetical protein
VILILLLGTQLPSFFSKHNLYEPFFLLVMLVPGAALWLGTYPLAEAKRLRFKKIGDVLGLIAIASTCTSLVTWVVVADEVDAFSTSALFAGVGTFGFLFGGAFYRRSMVKKDDALL